MTFLEAKQELARKLNIDYSDIANNQLFSDSDLGAWIQLGLTDAWDLHPWPFAQAAKAAATLNTDYYDYPSDVSLGSLFLLKVAGVEYKKLLFEDYQKYFSDNPTDTAKYWTEYGNFFFINKNVATAGQTLDLYGKKVAPSLANPTDLLPFSPTTDNSEYAGNQAIVLFAYSHALDSEKKNDPQKAQAMRAQALAILSSVWKIFAEARSTLQSNNRPFFNVPNYFADNPPLPNSSNNPGSFNF